MKLIINKFGPIQEKCEIDLSKKLTLFVGHNNSGKTYVTQLVWAINNYLSNSFEFIDYNFKPLDFFSKKFETEKRVFKLTFDDKILNTITEHFSDFIMNSVVRNVFKKNIEIDLNILLDIQEFNNISISTQIELPDSIVYIRKESQSLMLSIEVESFERNNFDMENEDYEFPEEILNKYIESIIFQSFLNENTTYMPSTRLFLPSFYKYIFSLETEFKNSLLKNFDKLNKKNKTFFSSSYTLAVDDLIKKLIFELDDVNNDNEYLDDLIKLIEGEITIDKSEDIGMVDISYSHVSGNKMPMYLSSSMVNQLATLYLYFKYWYQEENNFLLLDEPEMNLHPKKKIILLEQLLKFASNNKLLIATHSSTIAKSLINYMHLFDLREIEDNLDSYINENELALSLDISLNSNDIAIYYFNGVTVIPYKTENDSSIHFGTFSDVEKLQNKQYEYILERLEEYDT